MNETAELPLELSLFDLKASIIDFNEGIVDAIRNRDKQDPANHLDCRSMSGAVGDAYCKFLSERHPNNLVRNPHSDGHPDALPTKEPLAKPWIETPTKIVCPYGVDIKSKFIRYGQSIDAGASAHHVDTKEVLNVITTYNETNLSGSPVYYVIGLCFAKLDVSDWGKVSTPKENSHTTSSTSLKKTGIDKLRKNWIILDKDYLEIFGVKVPKVWGLQTN